jgi:aspartate carbamoyltransferase regulatory subunit
MGLWTGSGVEAYQADFNFQCSNDECMKENEDVSCWVESSVANLVCKYCGNEREMDL